MSSLYRVSPALRTLVRQKTVFSSPLLNKSSFASFTTTSRFSTRPTILSSPFLPRSTSILPHFSFILHQNQQIQQTKDVRSMSSSSSSSSSSSATDITNRVLEGSKLAISKLQTASTEQLYHYSSFALAGFTPIALILSPSILNLPVDLALGLIIPIHFHIGLNGILEDYIPKPQQQLSKGILLLITVFTTIGLLKINLCGVGITESFKSLWRDPKKKEEKRKTIKQ